MERAGDEPLDEVLAAWRAVETAVCAGVVPAIALLTRLYVRADRPRDSFFVSALGPGIASGLFRKRSAPVQTARRVGGASGLARVDGRLGYPS